MVQYKNESIKSLDKNLLQNFVNSFNKNLDSQKGKIEIKKIYNVDKFFEYWIGHIVSNGFQLNMKILKLVSEKFNKNDKLSDKEKEIQHLREFHDSDLFYDIFGP